MVGRALGGSAAQYVYCPTLLFLVHFGVLYEIDARVAQLVEHSTDTRAVPSSILGARTKWKSPHNGAISILCATTLLPTL